MLRKKIVTRICINCLWMGIVERDPNATDRLRLVYKQVTYSDQ